MALLNLTTFKKIIQIFNYSYFSIAFLHRRLYFVYRDRIFFRLWFSIWWSHFYKIDSTAFVVLIEKKKLPKAFHMEILFSLQLTNTSHKIAAKINWCMHRWHVLRVNLFSFMIKLCKLSIWLFVYILMFRIGYIDQNGKLFFLRIRRTFFLSKLWTVKMIWWQLIFFLCNTGQWFHQSDCYHFFIHR